MMQRCTPSLCRGGTLEELIKLLQAVADETRLRLLVVLLDHDATVSDVAARLGLPQPRVSTHLALLREVGLVVPHAHGRQRVYHVDAARVEPILAMLQVLAPSAAVALTETTGVEMSLSEQAARLVRRDMPIRHARSCYDHVAGVAGVRLLDELLRRGWLVPEEAGTHTHYHLTTAGEEALAARGVDIARARRARRLFAYACLDWTERRPHLGGSLAAAMLDALILAGIVRRESEGRALRVLQSLDYWLDN
jgi:DNA-binding transcriptional ArsR family regulator